MARKLYKKPVRDIVRDALIDAGYDGLFNEETDCKCDVDDLMPDCECYSAGGCIPGMVIIDRDEIGKYDIGNDETADKPILHGRGTIDLAEEWSNR